MSQERLAEVIGQNTGLPGIVCRILASRNVSPDGAMSYLSPSLRELMPDPSGMRDMDLAAERFWAAVKGRERIAVFADYDVDGGSSAALLLCWLRATDLNATLYVPDRIDEGYGPNVPAMRKLGSEHDLIVCVDCGVLSHEPIAAAGCDVIVLDHHLPGETLPEAHAVVNPNRHDEVLDLGYLCAAGVVFMMLVAVNRLMRQEGVSGPKLMGLLDLVALATVADVAPLVGLNRALVKQGLAIMAQSQRPGLQALARVGKSTSAPDTYSLGFIIGPRINAGGRIGAADLGARLLSTAEPHEADALAERLNTLNLERRRIEAEVLEQAKAQVRQRGADGPLVWASGEGWHPGVVGIVASRLKDAFGKPSIVIGLDGDDGKGSGRSVTGVDLGAAIGTLVSEGLLQKGGGHKMAVGLSIHRDGIEPAMQRLSDLMSEAGADRPGQKVLDVAGLVTLQGATVELAEGIKSAGPYGAGSPAPIVTLSDVSVIRSRIVGENHLAVTFGDIQGGRLDGIAFRALESEMGQMLAQKSQNRFHVAGRLERDDWGGRSKAKFYIEDAALS
ncbi:single-stranded-DNA-specific exonuclease RecJ [Amaricoccus tamworthensis]|uniref:single-stranded-DNA-specific exonuclease RecJ n=1 Tax=Amaricoccus tamworthensis TaxID=57002 RepID=UPI003C7AA6E4